jgi:predicted transcriptional regulator
VAITAELISAYLKNNPVGADDIPQLAQHMPELIRSIHDAFAAISDAGPAVEADPGVGVANAAEATPSNDFVAMGAGAEALQPAVPIEHSVAHDHVVCLEDGLKFRSLRPHLVSAHGLTPDAYRQKWGLAPDHPIVAPDYSRERAQVARKIGLGKGGRAAAVEKARKPK